MSCLKARVRAKSISGAWHVQRYPTLKKHCMTNISLTAHETCTQTPRMLYACHYRHKQRSDFCAHDISRMSGVIPAGTFGSLKL